MKRFAIYNYGYVDDKHEGTLLAYAEPSRPPVPAAERQSYLSPLFGKEGDEFALRGLKKGDPDYPCVVLSNQDGIVMLHLEHPKVLDVWEKDTTRPSKFPKIDKKPVASNPFCYVFIDCREGHNKIAIELNSSAWRKTDGVKTLLQTNMNMLFNNQDLGFNIIIKPETYSFDFLEQGRWHMYKNNRTVKWMTIHWNRGLIDPKVEAIVKHSHFFKSIFGLFSSMEGDVTLKNPNVSSLLRKKAKLAELFTMLIGSEQSDAFGVKWMLSNHRSYEWGEDIRIDFPMEDEILDSVFGKDMLFPIPKVAKWFNRVEKDIEEERNATNTQRGRKKKNP